MQLCSSVLERENFFLLFQSAKNKHDFILIFLLISNMLFIKNAGITILFPLVVDAIAIINIVLYLYYVHNLVQFGTATIGTLGCEGGKNLGHPRGKTAPPAGIH